MEKGYKNIACFFVAILFLVIIDFSKTYLVIFQ